MTTSAVRFGDAVAFVKDSDLRELVKAVAFYLPEKIEMDTKFGWLVEACASWIEDHENMPPGLKDIELDEWLVTSERVQIFREYLQWLKSAPLSDEAHNSEVLKTVIDKLEDVLFAVK